MAQIIIIFFFFCGKTVTMETNKDYNDPKTFLIEVQHGWPILNEGRCTLSKLKASTNFKIAILGWGIH